jgi:hypothetical protein
LIAIPALAQSTDQSVEEGAGILAWILGGRDRRAASASERARINVTRAIKIALERIAEHNPALATLLTNSIRTGTFCSYTPDARLPASWQL